MRFRSIALFVTIILAFGFSSVRADDYGVLLDLLVRKKLITEKDAAEVRSELKKKAAANPAGQSRTTKKAYDGKTYTETSVPMEQSPASKWKLSTPITELELYGDMRLRYEIRSGETLNDDTQQRNRERYRLRLGLRGILADDWFFGVRLETNANSRSTNVTFGDDNGGGNGPFYKGSDGMFVGQAYLGYKGFKDISLTGGRMPNPLVTTLMIWDPDINPEGLAEQWKHTFAIGNTAAAETSSFSKDGAGLPPEKTKADASSLKIDVFVNLGQFVYDDSNPENPLGPRPTTTANGGRQLVPNTDAFLLAWQAGARFSFPSTLYALVAPTFYNYSGNGDSFNIHYRGGDPKLSNAASLAQNQSGINSLLVFDMPAEIGWKLGDLPMRLFADFAVNLDGDDRATAAGHPNKGDQRYAYQVGAGVGQLKKKGDWQLNVFWQRQDQYALDPNLVDTEFWDTKLNLQGVGLTVAYMLSDAVWVQFLYTYAERADASLGTGGFGEIAINPVKNFQLFQADLNLKF
jgi:Putative porin